jgi:nucleotide-binding universal stress UspA family protein
MELGSKIIALVDGSSYSASVCDHAAWAAQRTGVPVELFHVLGRREGSSVPTDLSGNLKLGARSALLEELASLDAERARLAHARGRLILDEAAARLRAAGVAGVDRKLRNDDLLQTVAAFEADARAIVIGKRGEAAGYAHEHLGSNMERVLRSATRPVIIANRAFQPIRRYLIAFDGSRSVMNSIERIAAGTMMKGLDCRLLHAGAETPHMRAAMEGAAALLKDNAASVAVEFVSGEPEDAIAAAVENGGADLLVMGAYGHRRLRRLFLGSTSASMAQRCKVPLAVFR